MDGHIISKFTIKSSSAHNRIFSAHMNENLHLDIVSSNTLYTMKKKKTSKVFLI